MSADPRSPEEARGDPREGPVTSPAAASGRSLEPAAGAPAGVAAGVAAGRGPAFREADAAAGPGPDPWGVDDDDPAPAPGAPAVDDRYEHDAERDFAAEAMAAAPVRWLRVRHETSYRYDAEVQGAWHLAHLRPRDTATQQVRGWSLLVSPQPDAGVDLASGIRETIDPWGNARQIFAHSQVHDELDVVSVFEAGIAPSPLPPPGTSQPWREVARDLRRHAGPGAHRDPDAAGPAGGAAGPTDRAVFEAAEFTLDSALAPRAPALADWARASAQAHAGVLELALDLMHRVHEEFEYLPQSTSVTTGALEALALRHGVCQDFAHVLIGACRSLGLAARYVSGYLLTRPPPGRPRLVGADASHAWAAVWCPPHGWIALDPTNDVLVGQDHVTLAWGRDYADVAPLRGVIRGGAGNAPRVGVTVEPIAGRPGEG
jgi:transglutaminase-like putative cysteine protease